MNWTLKPYEQVYRIVLQEEEERVERKRLEQERLERKRIEQECRRQEEREQERPEFYRHLRSRRQREREQDEPEELGSEGQEVDQDSIYGSKLNSVGDLTDSDEEDIPIRRWSSKHPRRSKGSLEVDSNDADSTLFDGDEDEENRPLRRLKRRRSTDNSSDQEPDVGHQAKAKVKPKPRGKAKGQSKAKGKLPAEWRDVGDEDEENIPLLRLSNRPRSTSPFTDNSSDQEPDIGQQAKVKPRPRGKSQGKRPSEWRGIGASDGSAEDDADDDEDIPSDDPLMAKGPLPKSVKNEIDTAHAKFKAEIAEIAHKSGCELQSCYNYLDADNQVPRAANCFNIFQIWYGVHGEKHRKPGGMFIFFLSSMSSLSIKFCSYCFRVDEDCNEGILRLPTKQSVRGRVPRQ